MPSEEQKSEKNHGKNPPILLKLECLSIGGNWEKRCTMKHSAAKTSRFTHLCRELTTRDYDMHGQRYRKLELALLKSKEPLGMKKMQFSVRIQLMVWSALNHPKEKWLWRKSLPVSIKSCWNSNWVSSVPSASGFDFWSTSDFTHVNDFFL